MSIPATLAGAVGKWTGEYKLWLAPDAPVIECATTAEIGMAGAGRFFTVRYDWSHEGRPLEGFLLLGDDVAASRCDAVWVDSFHNSHRMMRCTGAIAGTGSVGLRGSYAAPPGPDWGWRTELVHADAATFVMRMFNITPDGQEALAVAASYRRSR